LAKNLVNAQNLFESENRRLATKLTFYAIMKPETANMKPLAMALIHRLLVSVAVVIFLGTLGITWGHFFGPSKIAELSIVLVAWPWALPQIFVVVCIVWFISQYIRRKRRSSASVSC
jgi:hypothetical protein